jgi:hypothetical protein
MSIVFDHEAGEVYIEVPENKYFKQEATRQYYFRPEGNSPQQLRSAQFIVNRMEMMYHIGKQHRSLEIRKILGV